LRIERIACQNLLPKRHNLRELRCQRGCRKSLPQV
jgi:hypothetical protein